MVQWLLGANRRSNEASHQENTGKSICHTQQLETIVTEIEAMLNNRPLTYVSPDLSDPEPLTPSHLLYGRRIHQVPHVLNKPEELEDPTYVNGSNMREKVDRQTMVIEKFCKTEYLTSLREFNKVSGHNKEVGDVEIVHNEKPRMQWRLAVVEGLSKEDLCCTYQNGKLQDNSPYC